jgi:hypothetical protein
MSGPDKEDDQQINLNTDESAEYDQWIHLLKEICAIQEALKQHPNSKGLKQARSRAYNVLANIQILLDSIENKEDE